MCLSIIKFAICLESLVTVSYNGYFKGYLLWYCSFKYVKYSGFHLELRGLVCINAVEVLNVIWPFCVNRCKCV